ncbi:N-carbamoylputrescine amidase [Aphanomyces invadans]|uniref:N-carbamoylputrescine amidase n=1 Tax=Aphanomyces invadans TaxID=157072 RepID=A0A024U792_9STRA|nr:N-carbamoylputrescine amidase [Aphanomyces invadans]ETW02144.1 N-carbamoylputrescine amidase [Aphanomyces invadans]|eukprot:XP_008868749.1 N-carbamoylputrescine amidase [Aphanomyces invadans]
MSLAIQTAPSSGYDQRTVTVGSTQMACAAPEANIKKAETLIRIAHQRGAQIVLLQELFQHTYFPIELSSQNFHLAETLESSGILRGMQSLAKELNVVLPVSFFERYKNSYYNSVAVIDADGSILGVVRKAHISDRLGYNDKYYFTPSDDAVPVFRTRYATIGVGIGSDQWYPEYARLLAIKGAEIIFYPSALGSNQYDVQYDPRDQWHRVMQGHAAASMIPIVVSNRVGTEESDGVQVTFCGSSFITGNTGELLKIADRDSEGVLVDTLPLGKFHIRRASWGLLRDRRPHLYKDLLTRDGENA